MKLSFFKSNSAGQSMFEVILALGVVTVVMVTIVSLVSISVRNANFSKNEALASRYAQETVEWLRGQRDSNWSSFSSKAPTLNVPANFCMKDTQPSWIYPNVCASTGDEIATTSFTRNVTLTKTATNSITADIKVSWKDSNGTHEARVVTIFTSWRGQ